MQVIPTIVNVFKTGGVWEKLTIFLHPFLYALTVPFFMIKSLWNMRVLISPAENTYYFKFSSWSSMTHLFYVVMFENFKKFGRNGISKTIANGDFQLSTWFHQRYLALSIYARHSYAVTVLGMLVWAASFLIWPLFIDGSGLTLSMIAVGLLIFSAFSYFQMFFYQNYNMLGWVFFPCFLMALQLSNLWMVAILVTMMSITSITAVLCAGLFAAVMFVKTFDILWIAAFIPAGIICILIPLFNMWKQGILVGTIKTYATNLGSVKSETSYKRHPQKWSLTFIYAGYMLIYILTRSLLTGVPLWPVIGLLIFIINRHVSRFADEQSTMLIMVSCIMFDFILVPNAWLIVPLIVAFNPVLKYEFSQFKGQNLYGIPKVFRPWDMGPLMESLEALVSDVKTGDRVLMAFDDPHSIYNNVFDGYRNLVEIFSLIATKKGFHIFPDWHLIFSSYGQDNIWGRSVSHVTKNMQAWNCDHVIVYQNDSAILDTKWAENGFEVEGAFDWADVAFQNEVPYNMPHPKMWLLKRA